MDEKRIAELLKNRDPKGLEELRLYYGPLIRYVISPIVREERDREECLADTAQKIWDRIDLFDPDKGSFKSWVTVIARNTALNTARRNKGRELEEELGENIVSPEPTPEEEVIRKENARELKAAISKLSFKDRALFYRKYYYLQPVSQIAAELSMTERAVEGKLYRLRKRLREYLGGDGNE